MISKNLKILVNFKGFFRSLEHFFLTTILETKYIPPFLILVSFYFQLKNGEIRKLDIPFEVSLPLPPATTPKPVIVVSEPLDVSGK